MKILIIAFLLVSIIFSDRALGQVSYADTASRSVSKEFLKNRFQDGLNGRSYILFSIADSQYLIIVDMPTNYLGYYFNQDTSYYPIHQTATFRVSKQNKLLEKAFQENSYRKDFINMNSNFFKDKHPSFDGLRSYFYLSKNGRKYGEESLPIFVSPSPLGKEIYSYFIKLFATYN